MNAIKIISLFTFIIGTSQISNANETFPPFERAASYPGGKVAFSEYIINNLNYPQDARKEGIEGTVYVKFTVSEVGEVLDIEIAKGIGYGCDEEVVRVFENMPVWVPAEIEEMIDLTI